MENENGGCFFLAIILTILSVIGILLVKLPILGVIVVCGIACYLSDLEGAAPAFAPLFFLLIGVPLAILAGGIVLGLAGIAL